MVDRKSEFHGKKDAVHNEHEHGLGAIISPPDARDFPLSKLLASAGVIAGAALPSTYNIPHRPPIIDQDGLPQCVAYSSANDQNAKDYDDFHTYFNFDEPRFFGQIGGTPAGASMRDALDRRLKHGYPVQVSGHPGKHRIAAYYRLPLDVQSVKTAIHLPGGGGGLLVGPWYHSWFHPNADGKLPPPDYAADFHAFLLVGWNDAKGCFKAVNTWGTDWGKRGKFYIRYGYLSLMLEAWKTRDT